MTLDANPGTRTLLLALSALAWSACGDDTEPAVGTVGDSAGVEIVTNRPGRIDTAEAWSLSSEPVVAIGSGASPEVPLHEVADVAPLGEGRVAVGTRSPARALVFGPDGALEATVETPAGIQPYAVRGDRVWGVFTDELDVESVRGYVVEEDAEYAGR